MTDLHRVFMGRPDGKGGHKDIEQVDKNKVFHYFRDGYEYVDEAVGRKALEKAEGPTPSAHDDTTIGRPSTAEPPAANRKVLEQGTIAAAATRGKADRSLTSRKDEEGDDVESYEDIAQEAKGLGAHEVVEEVKRAESIRYLHALRKVDDRVSVQKAIDARLEELDAE